MARTCHCHPDSPVDHKRAPAGASPEDTVGDVVRRGDGALEIRRAVGINHCCGAHLTLREAAAAGVPLVAVLDALGAAPDVRA